MPGMWHWELASTHGWAVKCRDMRLPVTAGSREDEIFVGKSAQVNNHSPKLA